MTSLLLDECGDLDITAGRMSIVRDADAVKQAWVVYIKTMLGEWFLNTEIGVPYTQRVLSKQITVPALKQIFTTASLEVPGILQVTSVIVTDLNVATRTADITVNVVVDGAEGPETGQFKYTGRLPPECEIGGTVVQGDIVVVQDNAIVMQG